MICCPSARRVASGFSASKRIDGIVGRIDAVEGADLEQLRVVGQDGGQLLDEVRSRRLADLDGGDLGHGSMVGEGRPAALPSMRRRPRHETAVRPEAWRHDRRASHAHAAGRPLQRHDRPVRLDGLERERRADRRSLGLHVGQAATTGGTRLGRPRIGDPGAVVLDRERHALRRGEHRDRDRSTRGVSRDVVEGERCDPEGRALHGPRRPDLRGVEHVHRHPRRSALLDALRQPLEARDQAQLLQHDRAPLRKQALDLAQDVAEVGRQPFDRAARLDRRQRAPYGGHDLGMELRGEPRAFRFGRLVARRRPARHQLIDEGRDARVQPARQAVDEPPIGRSGRPRDGPSASPSVRRHHIAQDAQPDEAQSRVLPPAHGECHDAHDGLARLGHRVGDDRPDGDGTGHDQPRGGHDPQPADGSVEAPRRGCGVAGGGRDRRRQCQAQDRRERRRARQSRWVADHEPEVDQVGRDDRVRRDGREPGEARLAAQPDAHDAQGRDREERGQGELRSGRRPIDGRRDVRRDDEPDADIEHDQDHRCRRGGPQPPRRPGCRRHRRRPDRSRRRASGRRRAHPVTGASPIQPSRTASTASSVRDRTP